MHKDIPSQSPAIPGHDLTPSDVQGATGIRVVTSLQLKGLLHLVHFEGVWTAFVSSSFPDRHQEVFAALIGSADAAALAVGGTVRTVDLHVD